MNFSYFDIFSLTVMLLRSEWNFKNISFQNTSIQLIPKFGNKLIH